MQNIDLALLFCILFCILHIFICIFICIFYHITTYCLTYSAYCNMSNMQNIDLALYFAYNFAYCCIYMHCNMQNMQNNMHTPKSICHNSARSIFCILDIYMHPPLCWWSWNRARASDLGRAASVRLGVIVRNARAGPAVPRARPVTQGRRPAGHS